MTNAPRISRELLFDIYNSGKSMGDVAKLLGCSPNKVVYWMNKFEISRRSRSDATYIKRNPTGDPFLIKKLIKSNDHYLFGLGLGIYWGEGEKTSNNKVRVTNSDPYVILTFSRFLQNICGVHLDKMRYSLICFNDIDPLQALQYWLKVLKISEDKFGKIVQIPTQGRGTYLKKSQNGVCTLTVSNTKLKIWILQELDQIRKNAQMAQW